MIKLVETLRAGVDRKKFGCDEARAEEGRKWHVELVKDSMRELGRDGDAVKQIGACYPMSRSESITLLHSYI